MFPKDYPFSPPRFRFNPPIYHPNVYKDGLICISILHKSGDATTDEPDGETWSPAQSVETVLISIVSLLSDPNINSPANVDAAVAWRKDRPSYNKRVAQDVAASKQNIPKDFKMPLLESEAYVAPKPAEPRDDVVDDDFWYESADDSMEDEDVMEDDGDESDNFEDEDDEDEEE
ncbi:SCF E2 ubiquitin-protein ligase catalytic subunit CDC34 [Sugiyamaella lignohabitans]|uniref:SCF E2 ubiquitin-protein ligase catalytic subunit CDC34 n=1 Tax=Sugiyamaella lignohabitans TaxID=796027 RepID=A0A170QX62_9ASCO|nr:SCF E2 ubiquitin-protein ligase catalytic subunit CDC34 [Sugiyamaella lignohabitans]ANB15941.1 SCF E2 ubiquitin-protein ligase catalytic subunit CDC34 [Sugiyamaella lignohabitans]